jgi:hypothetical protein
MVERRKTFSRHEVESDHLNSGTLTERPNEIREVFENTGYGCLAVETDIGVVHICRAADNDVNSFADKPILYQSQLIEMLTTSPTPLCRFQTGLDWLS